MYLFFCSFCFPFSVFFYLFLCILQRGKGSRGKQIVNTNLEKSPESCDVGSIYLRTATVAINNFNALKAAVARRHMSQPPLPPPNLTRTRHSPPDQELTKSMLRASFQLNTLKMPKRRDGKRNELIICTLRTSIFMFVSSANGEWGAGADQEL